jgi:hypothetical protein
MKYRFDRFFSFIGGVRRWARPLGYAGLFAISGAGMAHAGVASVQYYSTPGSAGDVVVTKDGHIVVSLSAMRGMQIAGVQIFNPSNQKISCSSKFSAPTFPTPGIVQVFGMSIFPYRPHQLSRESIGAAVEAQGAEFLRFVDLDTCVVDRAVNVPQLPVSGRSPGTFSIAITPAGEPEFAFVANEYGTIPGVDFGGNGTIGVIRTQRDANGRFTNATKSVVPGGYIYIPGASTMPGITMSKNGKYLYVVNEGASGVCGTAPNTYPCQNPTLNPNPNLATDLCMSEYPEFKTINQNGVLSIVDVEKAKRGWGQRSIVRTIAAGCAPVRVVESADGQTIWVATRGGVPCEKNDPVSCASNALTGRLLAFDTKLLLSSSLADVNNALIAVTPSGGTAPVGMALFNKGNWLAVANSNRFTSNPLNGQPPVGDTNVSILNVSDRSKPSVIAICKSSTPFDFPRGVAVGNNDSTVFVANFGGCAGEKNCSDPAAPKLEVISTTTDEKNVCPPGG